MTSLPTSLAFLGLALALLALAPALFVWESLGACYDAWTGD